MLNHDYFLLKIKVKCSTSYSCFKKESLNLRGIQKANSVMCGCSLVGKQTFKKGFRYYSVLPNGGDRETQKASSVTF